MTSPVPVQRQAQVKGGRKIRHVVYCSQDQHDRLVAKARLEGVTVAKLLVDTTLQDGSKLSRRALFNELDSIRKLLNGGVVMGLSRDFSAGVHAVDALAKRIESA